MRKFTFVLLFFCSVIFLSHFEANGAFLMCTYVAYLYKTKDADKQLSASFVL